MEKIPRAKLIAWAKKNNWLHVNESPSPNGHQDTFLTPSGAMRIIVYDLSGNLHSIVDSLQLQAQSQKMMHIPNLNLGKG